MIACLPWLPAVFALVGALVGGGVVLFTVWIETR